VNPSQSTVYAFDGVIIWSKSFMPNRNSLNSDCEWLFAKQVAVLPHYAYKGYTPYIIHLQASLTLFISKHLSRFLFFFFLAFQH